MTKTSLRSRLQIGACVPWLVLLLAAPALADDSLFASPPDPTVMAPIAIPAETIVDPAVKPAAAVTIATDNGAAPTALSNDFVQQCAAQADPTNFPTEQPSQLPAAQVAPAAAPENTSNAADHTAATPSTAAPAISPPAADVSIDNLIQQCNAQTDPANFAKGPPSLLPGLSDSSAVASAQAIPTAQPNKPATPVSQAPPVPDVTGTAPNSQQQPTVSPSCSSCAPGNSCNSSGCDQCDNCCRNWWVDVDYLAMWIQANHLPPLVTTSPAGTPRGSAGVLPGATILFGNDFIDGGARNGGRVTLGYWLDDDHNNAVEASWFTVGQPTDAANFFAHSVSAGGPILARPFTSGGVPNAQLAAFPGVVMGQPDTPGTIGVTTRTSMDFGEILFQHVFDRDGWTQMSWTAGYRHLEFHEQLNIFENMLTLPAPSTSLNVLDQFQTKNDFEGGQFGLQLMRTSGAWTLNGKSSLGFGNVHEYVNINGNTTVTDPLGNVTNAPGLLAQPSNDGVHSRNVFAFLPELELNLHYQLTSQIDLSVGYTFLLITRVARAGDQIDTNVSSTTLPTANPTSGIGNQPSEVLRDTSLWAQGISGGIELRF